MKNPEKPNSPDTSAQERAERREKYLEHTTLIIPNNDGESVMIGAIADHFGIDVRRIEGAWNSSKEDRLKQLKALTDFKKHIVAVELAVPEVENEWEKGLAGDGSFTWIDHHSYSDGLVRLKEGAGCSLDQFLEFFGLDEKKLLEEAHQNGFPYDPRFVKGVALNDDAFIRGMIAGGYSLEEIKKIRQFDRDGQYGEETETVHKRNRELFEARKVLGNISIMDFGDERINYTYAKDLAILEKIEEEDGKVFQYPVITFIIRPSINMGNGYDIAIDLEGEDKRRKQLFEGLNKIIKDRRVNSKKPDHSHHWYKADMGAEKLKEIQAFMNELAE
jgi:hypothetical protein